MRIPNDKRLWKPHKEGASMTVTLPENLVFEGWAIFRDGIVYDPILTYTSLCGPSMNAFYFPWYAERLFFEFGCFTIRGWGEKPAGSAYWACPLSGGALEPMVLVDGSYRSCCPIATTDHGEMYDYTAPDLLRPDDRFREGILIGSQVDYKDFGLGLQWDNEPIRR